MLKSSTTQIKMKETEIARLKRKIKDPSYELSSKHKHDISLPNIKEQTLGFQEPTKIDKINEIAMKYKKEQATKPNKIMMIDHFTMTPQVITRETGD